MKPKSPVIRSRAATSIRTAGFLALFAALAPVRAQVLINELLANNGLSGVDEDGDNSDWCELYNPTAAAVNLLGHGLTDDPNLPLFWVFPDIEVPAQGFLRIWLSGKDRFVPPPAAIAGNLQTVAFDALFIRKEEEWRFLVADPAVAGPPAGWNSRTFDDSTWEVDRAGFGYGDGDDFTELPAGTNAVFMRKRFEVPNPQLLKTLVLQVNFDDGFVAYLNGSRVAAANAPTTDPVFASFSVGNHEAGIPERFDLTAHIGKLVAGTNVLAVVGLNTGTTSSDMSIHPELGVVPLVIHTSFQLDNDGEYLALTRPDGSPIDEILFPDQNEDHAYGRSPDGSGPWRYLLTPTPEKSNQTLASETPFSSKVTFSLASGKYPTAQSVTISAEPVGVVDVRYTLDGSVPIGSSTLAAGPIAVTKNTVFRAAGFIGTERSTRVISQSYLIGGALALPIMSISMDPTEYAQVHNDAGASGRGSERGGYIEIFTPDGKPGLATGFGLRLHGGAGRGGDFETKKAYKAYFRRLYGDARLEYPLMADTPVQSFDKLVLRGGFNDAFRTNGGAAYIRDQLIRDLHRDMGALAAHGSWYNLYVNMKYRGVYNVTERMDEEFLQSYTGEQLWDVMKTGNDVLSGENVEWERLHTFAISNDLADPVLYDEAATMVDVENFTGYMIMNTWAQNHDWPHNNWYAARLQAVEGQWIYLCWDAEFGIGLIPGGYSSNSVDFALQQGGYIRDVFNALLANDDYRAYFAQEVDRHTFSSLRSQNVVAHIDRLRAIIAPDMPEEAALTGNTLTQWQSNITTCRTFGQNRSTSYRSLTLGIPRFAFPTPPRVFSSDQRSVVHVPGTIVRLRGVRFKADTRFTFDGLPAAAAKLISGAVESIMDVTLPETGTLSGDPVIAAQDPTGQRSQRGGILEVVSPVPQPAAIDPSFGGEQGGELVRIQGDVFLEGVQVRFGTTPATSVSRVDGGALVLEVTTPPGVGDVQVQVVNVLSGQEIPAARTLRFTYTSARPRFQRGDQNGDGGLDISDAVGILVELYLGENPGPCQIANDVNDSNAIDLSDAVYLLSYLFVDGAAPPAPHPACGVDRTIDELPCTPSSACSAGF